VGPTGRYLATGDVLDEVEDLADRRSDAGPEVERLHFPRRGGRADIERADVSTREVHDVDVVADRGPVRRGEVRPVEVHRLAPPECRFHQVRDEHRRAIPILAELGVERGSSRVEVAQADGAEVVAASEPRQHGLDRGLADPVGTLRRERQGLVRGESSGRAIDRAARREHEQRRPDLDHRAKDGRRTAEVDVEIRSRIAHRLGHRPQPGEMDDAVDPFAPQDVGEGRGIADVRDDAGRVPEGAGGRQRPKVDDDHTIAASRQLADRVGTDVAGAAGHQHSHPILPSPRLVAA
jgi:hypothetical protein